MLDDDHWNILVLPLPRDQNELHHKILCWHYEIQQHWQMHEGG